MCDMLKTRVLKPLMSAAASTQLPSVIAKLLHCRLCMLPQIAQLPSFIDAAAERVEMLRASSSWLRGTTH